MFQYIAVNKLHSPTASNFNSYRKHAYTANTLITAGRTVISLLLIHQVAGSLGPLDDLHDENVIALAVAHSAMARDGAPAKWRYIVACTHFVATVSNV
jgi:hypothetical protein